MMEVINNHCHDDEITLVRAISLLGLCAGKLPIRDGGRYVLCFVLFVEYRALPIYRVLFSPYNSRKTPIARPLGRGTGVFREIVVWPNFTFEFSVLCVVSCNMHCDRSRLYSSNNNINKATNPKYLVRSYATSVIKVSFVGMGAQWISPQSRTNTRSTIVFIIVQTNQLAILFSELSCVSHYITLLMSWHHWSI